MTHRDYQIAMYIRKKNRPQLEAVALREIRKRFRKSLEWQAVGIKYAIGDLNRLSFSAEEAATAMRRFGEVDRQIKTCINQN